MLDWFTQLMMALDYLHTDRRILHRDLKTQVGWGKCGWE